MKVFGITLLEKRHDGNPKSGVTAYFLIEWKNVMSIALLKFNPSSKEGTSVFHSHAFNARTWFLFGKMQENILSLETGTLAYSHWYLSRVFPKVTPRERFHNVTAVRPSWCFTIRGPWKKIWHEYDTKTKYLTTYTHGRTVVDNHTPNLPITIKYE